MSNSHTRSASVPTSVCKSCGEPNNRATSVFDLDRPESGDLSICFRCGHLQVFAADLTLRDLTDDEMKAVAGDKTLLDAMRARTLAMKDDADDD